MRRSSYSEAVRYRDTRSRYGQALGHERSRARGIKVPYLLAAIFIIVLPILLQRNLEWC